MKTLRDLSKTELLNFITNYDGDINNSNYLYVCDSCNDSLEDNEDEITDGFGNFSSKYCTNCGSIMVVVRPGKFRCSEECECSIK